MWTRAELKERAKLHLKPNYGYAILTCFVASLVGSSGGSAGGSVSSDDVSADIEQLGSQFTMAQIQAFFIGVFAVVAVILLLSFAIQIFVGYPLTIGMKRFFFVNTKYVAKFNEVGFGFKHNYKGVVWVQFLQQLKFLCQDLRLL